MLQIHEIMRSYFEMNVHHTGRHVIPFIEKYKRLLPGTRVLEIGCGEAGVLKAFLNRGCIGLGVDG